MGDDETHRAGCADLKQRGKFQRGEGWGTFSGRTLAEAIDAANADMAGAFGQKVYEPNLSDQPWTVDVIHRAPCFTAMLEEAGITFDVVGRPVVTQAKDSR